jgi:hypothetical protein
VAGRQVVPATQFRHSGRAAIDRRAIGEKLLDGRNRGRTMHEMVAEHGISEPSGSRYMRLALDARIAPTVDEYRKQQNDSLDLTERQNEEQIELAEHLAREGAKANNYDLILKAAAMRAAAIKSRIHIAERRARLNGLDAPVTVKAEVVHLSEVDAELADLVASAAAKVAGQKEERTP